MKWASRLLALALATVLVCGLTVLTTGVVVNAYVQSLLASLNIKWEGQPTSLMSMMKLGLAGSSQQPDKGEDKLPKNTNGSAADQDSNKSDPEAGDSKQGEQPPKDAVPAMGQQSEEAPGDGDKQEGEQQPVISPDELATRKEELPTKEKAEVFDLLMKKLPEQEMQTLTAAMEGGITESELIQIEQILSKYLSKEEYAKIVDILKK